MYKVYSLQIKDKEEVRYIGITKHSLNHRLKVHYWHTNWKTKTNKLLSHKDKWLNKNKNNIQIVLLEENINSINEANIKEIQYIKLFKSFGAKLINSTLGGDGTKGCKNKMKGKTLPETWKRNLQEARRGRKLSKTHRINIGKAFIGKKHTQNTKDLIRNKMTSEHLKKLSKKVVQFDLNNNLLNTFKSLTEASKITGQSRRAITEQVSLRVLKGKKYIWRYYDPNYDINNINISNKRKTEEIDGKDSQIPME